MAPIALRASSDPIELRDISKAFGGVRAVDKVSLSMYPGAYPIDSGQVIVLGQAVSITNPADSQKNRHRVHLPNLGLGRQRATAWPMCF